MIEQIQMGDYTIFRTRGSVFHDDVVVRPHPTNGADVLLLTSYFMDYGHLQDIHTISEEKYQEMQKIQTEEELEAFVDSLYKKLPDPTH